MSDSRHRRQHPRASLQRFLTAVGAGLVLAAAASAQATAPFPLLPGEAMATCASGSNPGGYVAALFDLRDPAANAPGFDRNWPAPAYHAAGWTFGGLGGNEVFGLAIDDATPPNVYLTSTSTYGGGHLGSGKVFRIDGATAEVSVFAELPSCDAFPDCPGAAYAGLGNVAYDAAHRQLFVTNFYDGKIYRLKLDPSGGLDPAATATFDPFAPFDAASDVNGFAPLGERPWGIGVSGDRVYFAVWATDGRFGRPQVANTVWSVALDAAGSFAGAAELEVSLPPLGSAPSNPVADIAFSVEGRMLLAERSMVGDAEPGAHRSRVLEYAGGHGAWTPSPYTFVLGPAPGSRNAAGGADYVCEQATGATAWVLATGDALHFSTRPPDQIYGIEIFPPTGGTNANAYLVDLDGDVASADKTAVGDVESVGRCVQAPPSPDLDLSLVTGVDAQGERLPRGAADPSWRVETGAGASAPAVVVAAPPASWRRFRASEWISEDASAVAQGEVTRFQRCFCLAPDAANAKLNLRLRADDEATVYLNGAAIAGPGGAFRRAAPMSVLYMGNFGESLFVPGDNCLEVFVRNTRGALVGLDAVGRLWVDHGACTEERPGER